MIPRILGLILLGTVLAGLFALTTWGMGWRDSLKVWVFAIAVTEVIVAGVYLAFPEGGTP